MNGEKETLAQIRIQFQTIDGTTLVATRNLQAIAKKSSARQFKALEGALKKVKNGQTTTVSGRVGELNEIIPQYLGVSKALLDSVIFCHQDESLWPMSEPSALKKRFDEIFEADKYTKAVDNIKSIRKTQNGRLNELKQAEVYTKETKVKAEKTRNKMLILDEELDNLRDELGVLDTEADDARKKAQEARDHAAKYTEDIEKLKSSKHHVDTCKRHLQLLKANLVERDEPDDWLETQLSQYEDRVRMHEEHQEEQTKRWHEINREIKVQQDYQHKKRKELGKFEAQEATHQKRIEQRNAEIKRVAEKHKIRGYEMELDDMQVNAFIEELNHRCDTQSANLDKVRNATRTETKEIQALIDDLTAERITLQETRSGATVQLDRHDKSISALHRQLQRFSRDEGNKATLESKLSELNSKTKVAKRQLEEGNFESSVRDGTKHVENLENRVRTFNQELVESSNRATELAKVNHLKKESKDRQRDLETYKGTYAVKLRLFTKVDWRPEHLAAQFENAFERKRSSLSQAEVERDRILRQREQLQFQLTNIANDCRVKEAEMEKRARACLQKLKSVASVRDRAKDEDRELTHLNYLDELAKAQEDYEGCKSSVEGFVPMQDFFLGAIDRAQKDKTCRLCSQKLPDQKILERFIAKLKKQFSNETREEFERNMELSKADLEKVKKAREDYETWKRLSSGEVSALKNELANLSRECDELTKKLELQDRIVADRLQDQQEIELFSKPVKSIVSCFEALSRLQEQIRGLEAESQTMGLLRSTEDIKDDLDKAEESRKAANADLAKIQSNEKRIREDLSTLVLESERTKSELAAADSELQQRTSINDQIAGLRDANKDLNQQRQDLDGKLADLTPRFREENQKLEDAHRRGADKEKTLQQNANELSVAMQNQDRNQQEIQEYIHQGGPLRLSQCDREISSLDEQIKALQTEATQVTVQINKIREEVKDQDKIKRELNDNLQYRAMQRELQSTEQLVERLTAQNAEGDYNHYNQEGVRWQLELDRIGRERTGKLATSNVKDKQLESLQEDWERDYKDAAKEYRKARVDHETTKAVVADLGRYATALDHAILKYHSIKMEQINDSMAELWTKTYQGTDVDKIMIRSDNETGKGNRSYNYRVCMVKGDVEMDMRGRCSAGQKVLASIIIRLALAECFGEHCGVIALDEPTTNLDQENIESLARALHEIIKQRRSQNNFQLIVITHDEDFVKYMRCTDFCGTYFKVYRDDADRQKSKIVRQSLDNIF